MVPKADRCICLAMLLLFLLPSSLGRDLRADPQSSRVRVLYIGDTPHRTWRDLAHDPFLVVQPVPASIGGFSTEFIRRSMRLYLPRTYVAYESGYDLLVLSDTDHHLFTTDQMFIFRKGVVDDGLGLIMAGGFEAFGGFAWGTTWKGSLVEEALPVESLTSQAFDYVVFYARPPEPVADHPLVTSLPFNSMPAYLGMNKVVPKQGTTVLLESVSASLNVGDGEPVLVYGEFGRGASVAHAPDWNPRWGEVIMEEWEYYGDYLVNMAYLVNGVSIPQDIELSHLVRRELAGYFLEKMVALSLLEFADRFGGNTLSLEVALGDIEELKSTADEHYLVQDYETVLTTMEEVQRQLEEFSDKAIRIKDQALYWVYAIEWAAVSGTMLVCGIVLWSLMVRRKAYKEVRTTRLRL